MNNYKRYLINAFNNKSYTIIKRNKNYAIECDYKNNNICNELFFIMNYNTLCGLPGIKFVNIRITYPLII